MPPTAVPPGRASPPGTRAVRYLVATALAAVANQACYAALVTVTPVPPALCPLVAAATIGVPTFLGLARWVWQAERTTTRQAAAYWSSMVVNVAAASAALWALDRAGAPHAALVGTPVAVYGASWVARFYVLDRFVFRSRPGRGRRAGSHRGGGRFPPGRRGRRSARTATAG